MPSPALAARPAWATHLLTKNQLGKVHQGLPNLQVLVVILRRVGLKKSKRGGRRDVRKHYRRKQLMRGSCALPETFRVPRCHICFRLLGFYTDCPYAIRILDSNFVICTKHVLQSGLYIIRFNLYRQKEPGTISETNFYCSRCSRY